MRRIKNPCSVCGQEIEDLSVGHVSCRIPCYICNNLIPNLNYFFIKDNKEVFRFCGEICKEVYLKTLPESEIKNEYKNL